MISVMKELINLQKIKRKENTLGEMTLIVDKDMQTLKDSKYYSIQENH